MTFRAVILDVYQTLLQVDPAPDDAEEQWKEIWEAFLGPATPHCPLSLRKLEHLTREEIAYDHQVAREAGIQYPEVNWPQILTRLLPQLSSLQPEALSDFMLAHAQLQHHISLMEGAKAALQQLVTDNVLLGIASNAQPYTLRELEAALQSAGQAPSIFESQLVFWSFEHGFSKPDPHVFRILAARLNLRGIAPEETVVVGDRIDNDMQPATTQGFVTWLLDPLAQLKGWQGGDWNQFLEFISRRSPE